MVNWGIIGPGHIAHKFAQDLQLSSQANCYAVASHTPHKSQEFAAKYGFTHYYTEYERLFLDEHVDVVYIATPHVFHYENALKALGCNKPVLCEKPIAINYRQLSTMIDCARQQNVFLMEALWSRFLPSYVRLKEILDSQEIGQVQYIEAQFGFVGNHKGKSRLFTRQLGGGALLDIGIYTVFLAQYVLGANHKVTSEAILKDGVDVQTIVELQYDAAKCVLQCSFLNQWENKAVIIGTKGTITLNGPFHMATQLTVECMGCSRTENLPFIGNGYFHEIEAVNTAIQNQHKESLMTHASSLQLMETLDTIRTQIGVQYEGDSL
jgi:predicted dehydrogenase